MHQFQMKSRKGSQTAATFALPNLRSTRMFVYSPPKPPRPQTMAASGADMIRNVCAPTINWGAGSPRRSHRDAQILAQKLGPQVGSVRPDERRSATCRY